MLIVDFHSHSLASHHAQNSIEELLRQSTKLGIEGIAITDHSPGLDNTFWLIRNFPETANWENRLKASDLHYFKTFLYRYQPPEDLDIHLFKGIECNVLGEGERATDIPYDIAADFDIVIASIHVFPFLFSIESIDQVTERMIFAMNDPIDILGHPFHRNACPEMHALVKAAVDREIVLELNNSSLQRGWADMEGIREMLLYAKKVELPNFSCF